MSTDEAREKFVRSYLTEEELSKMIEVARQGLDFAVPNYSKFFVGCCLLTHDGEYIMGCNIENISYSQSVHAEGCAISKAISSNKKQFKAVAVCARSDNFDAFIPPCGECRQFLNEFVNFMPVVLIHGTGCLMFEMLHELLPLSVILGADIPIANEPSQKYDSILFRANNWLMKDTFASTRNEMRRLLREWKFDEIDELTKEKLQFKEPGVLKGEFLTGPRNINYNTLQHIFEAFCVVNKDLKEEILISHSGDGLAESLAHRIVATVRSYGKTISLEKSSQKDEERKEGDKSGYRVYVEGKEENGKKCYEVRVTDGKNCLLTKETIEKIYEERNKLLVYRLLSEFYDYNNNKLK